MMMAVYKCVLVVGVGTSNRFLLSTNEDDIQTLLLEDSTTVRAAYSTSHHVDDDM